MRRQFWLGSMAMAVASGSAAAQLAETYPDRRNGPVPPARLFPAEAVPLGSAEPLRLPPIRVGQPLASGPQPVQPLSSAVTQKTAIPVSPAATGNPNPTSSLLLPQAEQRLPIDPARIRLQRQNQSWQLVAADRLLHDFGDDRDAAEEALRLIRGLRPTEWVRIGEPRSIVEYGLVNGEAPQWNILPKVWQPIDLQSLRMESIRGTWVVRDQDSILLNVGRHQADAEQAVAVARRYGFNRLAYIGFPTPVLAVFFQSPTVIQTQAELGPYAALVRAAQERNLTRTAIDIPGLGFRGERIVINPHKVEVRKHRGNWVLAHGPDILADFGPGELVARDALRVVQQARFTELCRLDSGFTFFLVEGTAPTRVPFTVQGSRFDANRLRIAPSGNNRWLVVDSAGRIFAEGKSPAEAEECLQVIRAYQFDQFCRVGQSPRYSLSFFARTNR